MTPDEVAMFHAGRPGYDLLDYAEVALPVYKVTLRVLLLQHTPLTPMYEFVLKAIRLGIDTRDEIAACLGIPAGMVEETLRVLHQSEEVDLRRDDGGSDRFGLTRKGEKTTIELERIRPEQQTIRMFFDGLTRQPMDTSGVSLLSGKEAEELGMREIPAVPHSRIEVGDIDLVAASRILSRERGTQPRRDLIAIKSVENRRRLHMPALAMVFQASGGGDVELLFANETIMLDEHNRRFALAEGPRKVRLLDEFSKPDVAQDAFSRKVRSLSKLAETPAAAGRKRTLRAKSPVQDGTIQPLSVQDHPPLLLDALRTATEHVMIICPWITEQVVDGPTLRIIEALLRKGVKLYVGYGIDDGEQLPRRGRKPIPAGIVDLAEKYDNFELRELGDTHEKLLIKDDEFEVVGSFNWLSFRGDPTRKLRREHSVKITDPAYVAGQFAVFEARLRKKPRKAKDES